MESLFQTSTISDVIQLAVAPVFLLAGISGALNVMSTRLGRIVDRGRQLNREMASATPEMMLRFRTEIQVLRIRAHLTNWAITLCTLSALFTCLVIMVLFMAAILEVQVGGFVSVLFVIAMLSLVCSFVLFLREIRRSAAAFRFGEEFNFPGE